MSGFELVCHRADSSSSQATYACVQLEQPAYPKQLLADMGLYVGRVCVISIHEYMRPLQLSQPMLIPCGHQILNISMFCGHDPTPRDCDHTSASIVMSIPVMITSLLVIIKSRLIMIKSSLIAGGAGQHLPGRVQLHLAKGQDRNQHAA